MSDSRDSLNRHVLPIRGHREAVTPALDIRHQEVPFTPPRPVEAPEGAPNVLVVLIDDMGFGAASAFGGPIEMPTAERLAGDGLSYTRFHTTGVCSPTRAALLTGRNSHTIGFGTIPELATASPGYNCVRPASAATIARVLKENGYSTGAFGKMHQTPVAETTQSGPFDRWPTGEGFERFYGFLGGETNQYYPSLFDGTRPVEAPAGPEDGYHLSEDLVDRAIGWVSEQQAVTPQKPFFAYLSFGATHAPLQVPREWVEKYRGRFDHGWDRQRELTLARQKEMGIVPADAELAPWVEGLPHWDELNDDERRAAALLMELYAGFAEHTDAQVGRLVDALSGLGALEDTLVFYVLGDNGASGEGGVLGSTSEWIGLNGYKDTTENILAHEEELGGPSSYPQYPAGWALAMDTPYQWMKQMASHYGGTRNPLIVHWPAGLGAAGEARTQWHHVTDIVPTILEAAGIPQPEMVDGEVQQPVNGISMRYSFADAEAPDRRATQYFEVFGNRGIYHEGWVACVAHRLPWEQANADWADFAEESWELYDTRADWTQADDLAERHPAKLESLKQLFTAEAARNQVLPLDDQLSQNFLPELAGRIDVAAGRRSVTYPGTISWLLEDAVLSVRNRSHAITAEVELEREGTTCVIAAQGGRFGGWSLYLKDGALTYCHNVVGLHSYRVGSERPLAPGRAEVRLELDYDGGGVGKGGDVRLLVDGEPVGSGRVERTTPFLFGLNSKFTIGHNPGLPVTDDYAAGAENRFAGRVAWVRIEVGDDGREERFEDRARTALGTH